MMRDSRKARVGLCRILVYLTLGLAVPSAMLAQGQSNPWERDGNDIFYVDGNVGIGTDDPEQLLSLQEAGTGQGTILKLRRALSLNTPGSPNVFQDVLFRLDPSESVFNLDVGGNRNSGARIHLGDAVNPHNPVTMFGNVGIGTTAPTSKLMIEETGNGARSMLVLRRRVPNSESFQGVVFRLDPTDSVFQLDVGGTGNAGAMIHLGDLETAANDVTMLGNVGIGTRTPQAKLDVDGTARTRQQIHHQTTGDKVSLFGNRLSQANMYGFGVEDFALYYKSNRDYRWYSNSNADDGASAKMVLRFPNGSSELRLRDANATEAVILQAAHRVGNDPRGARLLMQNPSEVNTITLDADWNGTGQGRVVTGVLEITGGSDLSEQFEVRGRPQAGMVVSIDPEHEGQLVVSSRAYDRAVAGIISGANGVQPGLLMGQRGSIADGSLPVALSGRVYCLFDGSNGDVSPGDLLTSSNTPGRCMKARDHGRAQGAILGKAMSRSKGGMVLTLVNLQ